MSRSLRARVTLGVVLALVLILGTFTVAEYARHRAAALSNLSLVASYSGQVIEANLRHAMEESDFDEVQSLLDAIGESEEIRDVYLLNTSSQVTFAPHGVGVGARLDNSNPTCQPCHRLSPEMRPDSVVVTTSSGQSVFRSMRPIENSPECIQCHDPNERLLGLLLTDISVAPLESGLAAHLGEDLLWGSATILVTVLVVNAAISRLVLRRLEGLAAAITGLGSGRLPTPLPTGQPDEIGQLASTFNMMAQQVEARNAENLELSESLRRQSALRGKLLSRLITAQEDERKRVARELHDELGQALGGLALQTQAMKQFITSDSGRALEQLDQTRELITETTDQMYNLILDLRPSSLDDLGLAAALRACADRNLTGTGITLEMDSEKLTGRLPAETETALFRVFQEALSNVVRHAGAGRVRITLAQSNGFFEGEILDDGRGFDPEAVSMDEQTPRGLGLIGMHERIALCSGHLEIISRPGSGTRVRIRVPVEKEESHG